MKYKEYGTNHQKTCIFLHGGGLSWWNYREEAELLQSEYHVMIPILDGHAGSDAPFTSIEDNAKEIISFIDEHFNGKVFLIAGLSLGAQILLEILSMEKDICEYAIVESAAVIPSKLTHALIGPSFNASYGLIKNRQFAKMQFKSLRIKEDLFEDYYRDTCQIRKQDMIRFMEDNTSYFLKDSLSICTAKTHIFFGEKENKEIRQSAEAIHRKLKGSVVHTLPNLYHGEFSINHASAYVDTLKLIIQTEEKA